MNKMLGVLSMKIEAVCPIDGMDGLAIRFKESANIQQRAAAQAILDAFDPVAAQAEIEAEEAAEKARAEWLKTAKSEVEGLKVQLTEKLAALETKVTAIEAKVTVAPK